MGSALSLFRATDYFDVERVVDDLDTQLSQITTRRSNKLTVKTSINRGLILYSTAIFLVLIVALYAYLTQTSNLSTNRTSRFLATLFVLSFPLIIFFIKKIINISINLSIKRDDQLIDRLESRRQLIVNQFLEKTKYKDVQRIVDKFSKSKPGSPKLNPANKPPINQTTNQTNNQSKLQTPNTQLNNKAAPQSGKQPNQLQNQTNNRVVNQAGISQSINQSTNPSNTQPMLAPGQPYATHSDLTRFARVDVMQAPTKRSVLDKFVDFVLNDGPNHRYALICSNCFTHNGLIRPEDYDNQSNNQTDNQTNKQSNNQTNKQTIKQKGIRFRCCYCHAINGPPLPNDWQPSVNTGLIIQSTPAKQSDRPLTMSIETAGDVQSINQRLADLSNNQSNNPSAESSPAASPVERSRATSGAENDEKSEQSNNQSNNQSDVSTIKLEPIVSPVNPPVEPVDESIKDEKTEQPAPKLRKRR